MGIIIRKVNTHITHRQRIKRLLAVLAIAFCWAHRTGEWQHENVKPIKVKKHLRLAKSIFRIGLDFIRKALFNITLSLEIALRLLNERPRSKLRGIKSEMVRSKLRGMDP